MKNRFIQISQEKFHFLETKYGERLEIISDNELRFSYGEYWLRVIYDNKRSYELDILLCQEYASASFSLKELARYAGISTENFAFQASSETRLEIIINRMANLLLLVCDQVPIFSSETMKQLQQEREKTCHEYANKNKLVNMRADAEKAWEEKNFEKIVTIYKPYLDELSKSEIKKYEYALKRMK